MDGSCEDLSMHSSSAAVMSSVSPYGSAERSFRNHSEASEEAAMTRQVLTLAGHHRMLIPHAAETSDAMIAVIPPRQYSHKHHGISKGHCHRSNSSP